MIERHVILCKSYSNVAEINYFGITVTDQKYIHAEHWPKRR